MAIIYIIHIFCSPLFLLGAVLFRFFKTERLNAFFGHRHRFAHITQDQADTANQFVANIMVGCALCAGIAQIILIRKYGLEFAIGPSVLATMTGVFISYVISEIYLSDKFEK